MKQTAYEASEVAYAVAVCGMAPAGSPRYEGDFDIAALVEDAPKPKHGGLREHQACWAEFRRMFHLRYAQFEAKQRENA